MAKPSTIKPIRKILEKLTARYKNQQPGAYQSSGDKATAALRSYSPTKAFGATDSASEAMLRKQAPETLMAPQQGNFASQQHFDDAVQKYNKFGNWASSN